MHSFMFILIFCLVSTFYFESNSLSNSLVSDRMSSKLKLRKSEERGHAQHGWLDSYHTFSFADYLNPKFDQWGSLRVINEDRVSPSQGFGTHPHRDFEIFSYIIAGELEHKDSMGNKEILKRGHVQFTSAGRGIMHSEFNANDKQTVHFLQIWVIPSQNGLKPSYSTMEFPDNNKKNVLLPILSPITHKTPGTIAINNDVHVFASILDKDSKVEHSFAKGRRGYIHLCQTKGALRVSSVVGDNSSESVVLNEGDGVFISDVSTLTIEGLSSIPSEFLLFDLA